MTHYAEKSLFCNMDIQYYIDQLAQDNLLFYFTPIALILIFVEAFFDKAEYTDKKDTLVSLAMTVITLFIEFIPKVIAFGLFMILHELSPLQNVIMRQWWAWLILFFLDDFSYYWFHRMNHEVRLFWAGHVAHHSSQQFNFGTAFRQGAGERLHKYIFWLWLPLLGFDALMIFLAMSVNLLYQFFVHTEIIYKFPKPIEYIFNTPSHHRVHHASNVRYLDCNHAGALIIWDRIFGTFSEEMPTEKPVYGLTKNINSYNPAYVATHEYGAIWADVRNATSWKDKLNYIFRAPGWSHDGEDLRAKTLRAKLNQY